MIHLYLMSAHNQMKTAAATSHVDHTENPSAKLDGFSIIVQCTPVENRRAYVPFGQR